MNDLKALLNPHQLAAVTTIDGPILVIAGAGSGKTRVIEYRVMHMTSDECGIDPRQILLLTFTRKAAAEMLSRAAKHEPRCSEVEGGTFHSFAFRQLKRHAHLLGPALQRGPGASTAPGYTSAFTVLDEGDAEELIHKCGVDLGYLGKHASGPALSRSESKSKKFPHKDTLKSIISASINKNLPISAVVAKAYPHFEQYIPEIENLRQKYNEYKFQSNLMDYDDLLQNLYIVMKQHPEIRDKIAGRYKYIMVDEYQDTNFLQGEITFMLGKAHENIMIVGDDAQSIYGFRGACHTNIMEFPKRFPTCKIIKLEENYRSTQAILDVANSVMDNMLNKYSKCLRAAKPIEGQRARFVKFDNTYEEAEWLAGQIKLLRDSDIPLAHQAVLYRSGYISIPLQAELSKQNIPFQVFGGRKFYETAHVKDILAHLKLITNPRNRIAWSRTLNLIEGIGPRTSESIYAQIRTSTELTPILNTVQQLCDEHKPKYAPDLASLSTVLKNANQDMYVGEKFKIILDYYIPVLKNTYDDWHIRINDLEVLGQISTQYESLEDFLADFTIEPPSHTETAQTPTTPDGEKPLTLSTIHSAKGLEWEAVFVIGMADGKLPSKFSLSDDDELEEEHRLFYVAITRAKKHLCLSMHNNDAEDAFSPFSEISRFIDRPNVLSKLDRTLPQTRNNSSRFGFRAYKPKKTGWNPRTNGSMNWDGPDSQPDYDD